MAKANAKIENKEVVIKTKVNQIQVYSNGDNIRYRTMIDDKIDAIVRNRETEEYETGQVDYIDFLPRVMIAQCLALVDGLDLMYTSAKEKGLRNGGESGFGATQLQVVLRGATIEIKRTKFEAGDEYTDADGVIHTHDYAGYNTDIVGIKVTDRIQRKLDDLIDKMFDL